MSLALGDFRSILLARTADPDIRAVRRRSGGAVTALLMHLLRSGDLDGVVIPVGEGLRSKLVTMTSPEDVLAAARDYRPVVPDLKGLLDRIQTGGLERVAVMITPCQAQGLRHLDEFPLTELEVLKRIRLVISPFCFGTFTDAGFARYLEQILEIRTDAVTRARNTAGSLEIAMRDGSRRAIQAADVVKHTRSGCLLCTDLTGLHSYMSTGVLTDAESYTALIVRTDRAHQAVCAATEVGVIDLAGDDPAPEALLEIVVRMADEKTKHAWDLNLPGRGAGEIHG